MHSLCNLSCYFYTFNQRELINTAFIEKLKLKVDIIEQYGGELVVRAIGLE